MRKCIQYGLFLPKQGSLPIYEFVNNLSFIFAPIINVKLFYENIF